MRADNIKLAVIFSLLAAFFYSLLGTFIKMTSHSVSNQTIVFFRQFIGIITLMPILGFQKGSFKNLKTKHFPLHLLRAFASLAAMYCFVFSLQFLPLIDGLLLTYTRPLFIPIVVFLWFKKKWTKSTWVGLFVGFLGVALILKPGKEMFNIAAFAGIASAMFGAIAFTAIRRLTKKDSANTILFYYLAISVPIALIPMVLNWTAPTLKEWGLLVAFGITGTIYQMTLTRAYQYARAFQVASMLYSTVIFGAFFDWWLGDFSIDYLGVLGIICVILEIGRAHV